MATAIRVEAPVGDDDDKTISFETGKLAPLAGGAVLAGTRRDPHPDDRHRSRTCP